MSILAPQITSELPKTRRTYSHLGYVDGLRGLAALYVMLYHARLTEYWGVRQPSLPVAVLTGWLGYGHFAVNLFIVLSGFCLMLPVVKSEGALRGGARDFFKRRARRILPPYYAALGLSILLATTIIRHKTGTIWDYSLPVTKMGILAHFVLLQDIHRSLEINSVFWSIAVECQIYLLFPLVLLAYSRWDVLKGVLATILLACTAALLLHHTRLAGLTCHYLGLFAMGNLAAVVARSPETCWANWRKMPWHMITAALFAFIVLACSLCSALAASHAMLIDLIVGAWAAALLVAGALQDRHPLIRALSWKPLVWVGTFSYSIYLIHMPLLQLAWQYGLQPAHMGNTAAYVSLTIIALTLIVGAAYLFHLAFERPFMSQPKPKSEAEAEMAAIVSPAP